jgi:hypothetical protein
MKEKSLACQPAVGPLILLILGFTVRGVAADLDLSLLYTDLGGGIFQYELTVNNQGTEDVSIVSITDAPVGDLLITSSLTAPTGFVGSYDSGLGFIDFLEDTDLFAAGTTHGGFTFQSGFAPGAYFTSFEALTSGGDPMVGGVTIIPEPSGLMLFAIGLAGLIAWRGSREKEWRKP